MRDLDMCGRNLGRVVIVVVGIVVVTCVYTGCVCTCVTASAEVDAFESACIELGGRVRVAPAMAATHRACVADAGVIATWIVDDDGGTYDR